MPSSHAAAFDDDRPPVLSIGATLEQVRLNHRISRLNRALTRLDGIVQETRAAGQGVPPPLVAAQRAFEEDLAAARLALRDLGSTA